MEGNDLSAEEKMLRAKVQEKKIVFGLESVLRALKNNALESIFFAKNCPATARADIKRYAQLVGVRCVDLGYTNEELGVFCKRNHFIAVMGALRG